MMSRRVAHSFISVNMNCLMAIGGMQKDNKYVLDCEKYDITNDKWNKIGKLAYPKVNAVACAIEFHVVYVFGGHAMEKWLNCC